LESSSKQWTIYGNGHSAKGSFRKIVADIRQPVWVCRV